MKALGLSVFTGKNYFLTEFAALSKNVLDKMSEVFVNKTLFRSFWRKSSGSNGTSEKVVLFFRTEYSKQKFGFHFFKAIFDSSFRPSRSFSGRWNWFVQVVNAILGRNLPVLNFAYHLPKPRTDRFAHVNGKQPKIHVYAKRQTWICTTWPNFPLIVVYSLLLLHKNK